MIRLEIVADRQSTADDLAHLLAADEQIEVVSAAAVGPRVLLSLNTDVVLAVRLLPQHISGLKRHPVVGLAADAGSPPAGVHAWLPLDSSPQTIVAALIAAACGLYILTSDQIQLPAVIAAEGGPAERLTGRELEVLTLMAEGLGNKQIAAQLKISGHTAKFHVAQVLAKLRAGSRTEAVRTGIRRGLVAL